jgi:hypothetical protein
MKGLEPHLGTAVERHSTSKLRLGEHNGVPSCVYTVSSGRNTSQVGAITE